MQESKSKVLAKFKELSKSQRAMAPLSTRVKFLGSGALHSRVDPNYKNLYNTSPRRKIEMLKEARLCQLVYKDQMSAPKLLRQKFCDQNNHHLDQLKPNENKDIQKVRSFDCLTNK